MQFSAAQIAQLIAGEVEGEPSVLVHDVSKIEEGRKGTLTFLSNLKYADHLYHTGASIALVGMDFKPARSLPSTLTLIRVADPRIALARLLELKVEGIYERTGVDPMASVHPQATLGREVYVGPFTQVDEGAVLGDGVKVFSNCHIGRGTVIGHRSRIHSNVSIYHDCRIGDRCTIHSGTVIGSDGFGFQEDDQKQWRKLHHVGNVVIEDDVEIGASCTIDRGTMGSTFLRTGVKLDNLIQIAHNVDVGAHTIIISQTGIAGSTRIGRHCRIGGQVGIVGHLRIGDRVSIAAQSGVSTDLQDDSLVQGSPAFDIGPYKRSYVVYRGLPELKRRIDDLEKELAALKDMQER
ncbi:MAG: UDP-3-O-(3-hydroxymyristoyl)glucosamine N-acyltransferase [Flavobacteriales bacterium]|nr:UDP-3-O-(3-hydroxymyristoyl)glucosamine N-acyltransferase [Flavobacteriales bacterium]